MIKKRNLDFSVGNAKIYNIILRYNDWLFLLLIII